MEIFAPSYYKNFKCTADKCQNNCCIGWEIDIDEDTLSFYKDKPELINHISFDGEPHFILGKNERCPLLNENNLCKIIENYGENHLCQICADHPRFRNYYDTRMEIGLGLSCEAAAKLILNNELAIIKIDINDDIAYQCTEESDFFINREKLIKQDIMKITELAPDIQISQLGSFLSTLERLDNSWDTFLNKLQNSKNSLKDIKINDLSKAKNLLNYFIYRHLCNTDIKFCIVCTLIIIAINEDIYEVSRMFSSEIEYSDENIDKLYEYIKNKS